MNEIFIEIANLISKANYDIAQEKIDEIENLGNIKDSNFAEALGIMSAKIQSREYLLELKIDELNEINEELKNSIQKIQMLEQTRKHLSKFAPKNVDKDARNLGTKFENFDKKEKNVSAIFLDVEGFTKMTQTHGAYFINSVIEQYFSAFIDEIQSQKGDISSTQGDGLMVIFASENDNDEPSKNAIETALKIREITQKVNLETSLDIKINIGISEGNALIGYTKFKGVSGERWTYTAYGETINRAARLSAKATNGEIFLDKSIFEKYKTSYCFQLAGEFCLKNIALPVVVYKLKG